MCEFIIFRGVGKGVPLNFTSFSLVSGPLHAPAMWLSYDCNAFCQSFGNVSLSLRCHVMHVSTDPGDPICTLQTS